MYRKSEKGFTLIELLVVVAILGVLSGIALPRVLGALSTARTNADLANTALVQQAVERYILDTGNWPINPPSSATVALTATTTIHDTLLVPTYLSKWPARNVNPGHLFRVNTNGVVIIASP